MEKFNTEAECLFAALKVCDENNIDPYQISENSFDCQYKNGYHIFMNDVLLFDGIFCSTNKE